MGARRSSGTLATCGVDTVLAARPSLVRAGLASHPRWPAGLASRGRGRRRRGARAGAARARDSNTAAMTWLRGGRGVAGRLGGERVDLGWGGRAAGGAVRGSDPGGAGGGGGGQ